MRVKPDQIIYYKDYFGYKRCGQVMWVDENGDFSVTDNPTCRMVQYDDARRWMNIKDEGTLFWLEPTPENPIPIKAQRAMAANDLDIWLTRMEEETK